MFSECDNLKWRQESECWQLPRCGQWGYFWARFDPCLDQSWCHISDHLTWAAPFHFYNTPTLHTQLKWVRYESLQTPGRKENILHPLTDTSRVKRHQWFAHLVIFKFGSYRLYNSFFSCLLPPEVQRLILRSVCLSAAKVSTPQQSSQIHFKYKLVIKDRWWFTLVKVFLN